MESSEELPVLNTERNRWHDEIKKLKEENERLDTKYHHELLDWRKTFDKQLGQILDLKKELSELKKKPEKSTDVNTTSALRQLATHVNTFLGLYDPKVFDGNTETARRLRDIRDRARAALEYATLTPPTLSETKK
jgi:hypothetical protein